MATGSGQGTPIVIVPVSGGIYDPTEELLAYPNCAVSLPRYARLVGYFEPALWGVVVENSHELGCGPLWKEDERSRIQYALAEAQQIIENLVGFPLCPTWVVGKTSEQDTIDFRWIDQQRYKTSTLVTRYPRLIAAGVRAEETVSSGAGISHGSKLGIIGPLSTDAESPNEIKVYYPGSRRKIEPSKITLAGGEVTIEIPRYRLVIADLLNTPETGILYDDENNFLSTADVVRVYNDPSTQAELVKVGCTCTNGCGECTETGCIYIRNGYIGEVIVRPATWSAETEAWTVNTLCRSNYRIARLHYLCGAEVLDIRMEMAIVKLAHSLLGGPPCTCDRLAALWKMDNAIPPLLTRERINCPFGLSNGAWAAYVQARSWASVRASIL